MSQETTMEPSEYRTPARVAADNMWFDETETRWRMSHADPSDFRQNIENEMVAEAIAWARYYRSQGDHNAAAGLSAFAARHGFDEHDIHQRADIDALLGLPRRGDRFPVGFNGTE